MQRDPAEEGLNLYEYVSGEPGSKTDPTGASSYSPGSFSYSAGVADQPGLILDKQGNIQIPDIQSTTGLTSIPANSPPVPSLPPVPGTSGKLDFVGHSGTPGESLGEFKVTAYNIANESDYPDTDKIKDPGLSESYNRKFLQDIRMQGSGIDRQGRKIQLAWKPGAKGVPKSYRYVPEIKTTSGYDLLDGVSIAVDPSEIRLGTWVYIETVGWRKATDTGTKVKGKHIDLFKAVTRAQALAWGSKNLCVWKEKA